MATKIHKLNPILIVEDIESCLPFWAALGFEVRVAVPEGQPLAFAMLGHGEVSLMLQTRTSFAEDVSAWDETPSASCLYLDVDDLDEVAKKVADAPIVVARRKTFYGADEIFVREPGGNVIGFAQHAAEGS